MKRFKKVLLVLLTVSLVSPTFYSVGWPQNIATDTGGWSKSSREEFDMADILIARPLAVLAGIVGSGILIVSLPFTIPTNSVNTAAEMLVMEPFRFSFAREFPDEEFAPTTGPIQMIEQK
jgi:hypothetical protein